jgi:hypothetical protein
VDDSVLFESIDEEDASRKQAVDLVSLYLAQVPAEEPKPLAVEKAIEAPLIGHRCITCRSSTVAWKASMSVSRMGRTLAAARNADMELSRDRDQVSETSFPSALKRDRRKQVAAAAKPRAANTADDGSGSGGGGSATGVLIGYRASYVSVRLVSKTSR